jgi:epoxyqueuosine reductase
MKDYDFLSESFLSQFQITKWGYTEEDTPHSLDTYHAWVEGKHEGPLSYLSDWRREKRNKLSEVFPKFQSALVFLFDYKEEKKRQMNHPTPLKVASYVTGFEGQDYHFWIKEKLNHIVDAIEKDFPGVETFYSIDAQPILERDLAYRAGLGWFGKNSMLINQEEGSYFLIAAILLDKKLDIKPMTLATDHCGTCTRCIDQCPTDAILDNRTIAAEKCISTYTIELFKEAPATPGYEKTDWIYGCDICQEVCPWNTKPLSRSLENQNSIGVIQEIESKSRDELIEYFESMSNRQFRKVFYGTPLARTGRIGLLKNLTKDKLKIK